jgi:hypothetical protein
MRHFFLAAASLVVPVASTAAALAAPMQETQLNCGDRITQDTRLTANLDCWPAMVDDAGS